MTGFAGVTRADLVGLVLHSSRLTLRPWEPQDAPAVQAIMADPGMHEYLALPNPYTDAHRFVTGEGHRQRRAGTGFACTVVESATGRLVGSAELRLATESTDGTGGAEADVGYWTGAQYAGTGIATEAARAVTDWAFGHGVHRVRILADVRNVASARVALAAGFRYEGVARSALNSPGKTVRHDAAVFARLATDDGERVPPRFAPLTLPLDDGVVGLRVLAPADATAVLGTDDELTLGWSFDGRPHTFASADRFAGQAGLLWLVGSVASFAMVDLAGGATAGVLNLRLAGPPGVGGVGYVVHPAFRGRGFTTRALRLLTPWAFDVAGFARLELGAKVGNVASQRAALAAGFEADGVRRARLRNPDGTFSDEVRFALINPPYA